LKKKKRSPRGKPTENLQKTGVAGLDQVGKCVEKKACSSKTKNGVGKNTPSLGGAVRKSPSATGVEAGVSAEYQAVFRPNHSKKPVKAAINKGTEKIKLKSIKGESRTGSTVSV